MQKHTIFCFCYTVLLYLLKTDLPPTLLSGHHREPLLQPRSSVAWLSGQGQGQASDWCGLGKELPVGSLRWGAPQTRGGGSNTGQPPRGTGSMQGLTEQPG